MNAEKLVRADQWWRLKQKLEEELLGQKKEYGDMYGFDTDA